MLSTAHNTAGNKYSAQFAATALAKSKCDEAIALHQQGEIDRARIIYEEILSTHPEHFDSLHLLGVIASQKGEYARGVALISQAVDIKVNSHLAHFNLGFAKYNLNDFAGAVASYDKAIELKPNYAKAHSNRGGALKKLYRLSEALESYELAIQYDPTSVADYSNIGRLYLDFKQLDKAKICFSKGLKISCDFQYLCGLQLLVKNHLCDWNELEKLAFEILDRLTNSNKVIDNFPLLALTDSLELQRKASEIWVQDKHPFDDSLGPLVKRAKRDKIRIGYYSADFHNHATAYLMAELFERHDRSKFELFAFSFGPDKQDGMRQRLTQAFDQFIDVRFNSDKEVAEFSRMLGIDIAVDLKGSTKDHRFGIFSYRAAPVQVSYIGYPGTMGADYIDYLIADKTVVPQEHQKHYSEKIIYLPDSYQVNDRKRVIADKTYTRQELGLPSEGFVFCCFNNNYKITPSVFDSWVRILKAVPNSVLWLFQDNPLAAINLRKEAKARGIDEARLVFAKSMPLDHHLARHSAADLFLDTTPVNAHTTASDALWAGLPLLTCMGESFASRVAASLLKAVGMPELIANTQEEYETKAIELAQNPDQLNALKQKLQSNRLSEPLFDTEKITRHIEQAYADVYERYHTDLMPENIYVERCK